MDLRDLFGRRRAVERLDFGLFSSRAAASGFPSVAHLDGGTVVSGNSSGVSATFGARLSLGIATIESNGTGIVARGGSTVNIADEAVIQNNTGDGLSLHDTSIVGLQGDAVAQIVNNGGWGVNCSAPPATAQIAARSAARLGTVSGNKSGQINCPTSYPPAP